MIENLNSGTTITTYHILKKHQLFLSKFVLQKSFQHFWNNS